MAPMLHIAFLRGIGPARKVPGAELRACFAAAGYDPVIPVLATGNVIFGSDGRGEPKAAAVQAMLEEHFGFAVPTILRSQAEIEAMFAGNPFAGVDLSARTRFVTLLPGGAPKELPKPAADANYRIVGSLGNNVFTLRENEGAGTPEMMAFLERALGKTVTTRNWNTMEKIAAQLGKSSEQKAINTQ